MATVSGGGVSRKKRDTHNLDPNGGGTRQHISSNNHQLDPGGGATRQHISSKNHQLDPGGGARPQSAETQIRNFGRQIDKKLYDAAGTIKRGSIGPNPTASGSGREWENHKYVDKVKTKNGTTRYIYLDTANKKKSNQQRKQNEKDPNWQAKQLNINGAGTSAAAKNQVIKDYGRNIAKASAGSQTNRAVKVAANVAAKSGQAAYDRGASFVQKATDQVMNTPIGDLIRNFT